MVFLPINKNTLLLVSCFKKLRKLQSSTDENTPYTKKYERGGYL